MKSYVLACVSISAGDARARDTELYTVHVGNLFYACNNEEGVSVSF